MSLQGIFPLDKWGFNNALFLLNYPMLNWKC